MCGILQRPTVLVVEDDEATLQMYAAALRDDFKVFVAKNAAHALAVGEELNWDADILVVDLALGSGLRGDQLITQYRARSGKKTPVIVVSGAPRAYDLARLIRPQSILYKPVEIEELIRQVGFFARPAGGSPSEALHP